MHKFTSRKFWVCVGACLASLATSITALHSDNSIVASIGIICTIASAAVYATVEAYVDANRTYETVVRDDDDRSDVATLIAEVENEDSED